jgi:hypothetical protein
VRHQNCSHINPEQWFLVRQAASWLGINQHAVRYHARKRGWPRRRGRLRGADIIGLAQYLDDYHVEGDRNELC